MSETPIAIGDFVRDRAELGGKVIALTGTGSEARALVQWNNGHAGWISTGHLNPACPPALLSGVQNE